MTTAAEAINAAARNKNVLFMRFCLLWGSDLGGWSSPTIRWCLRKKKASGLVFGGRPAPLRPGCYRRLAREQPPRQTGRSRGGDVENEEQHHAVDDEGRAGRPGVDVVDLAEQIEERRAPRDSDELDEEGAEDHPAQR